MEPVRLTYNFTRIWENRSKHASCHFERQINLLTVPFHVIILGGVLFTAMTHHERHADRGF